MEKARRKRVNTCLDQLRSLLPFTTTLKRDMASLLEQTVEYINTMHTVLNEDKPACLSKIYTVYQKKIEEHDLLRKGSTPKSSKRKISGGGSCSHGHNTEQPSPDIFHAYTDNYCTTQNPSADENDAKRQCLALSGWDQSIIQQAMSTPTASSLQNWQLQQHMIESAADRNNNGYMHPLSGVPYERDCRGGLPGPNCYLFGQSPLTNQYSVAQRPNDQQSPSPSGKYLPFSNFCSGLPKLVNKCVVSPSMENAFQRKVMSDTASQEENESKPGDGDDFSKGRNDQSCFNVSSLVSSCDQHGGSTMQKTSPYLWHQQHNLQPSFVPYNNPLPKSDNPTHNLLAPMDMSESARKDPSSDSPHFMGVDGLLGKARKNDVQSLTSRSREMGIFLKSSSVSNMLNEVTGMSAVDYPRVFGSTERKVTPVLGFSKDHNHSFWDDRLHSAVVLAMGRSTSAPATVENGDHVQTKVLTPSCTGKKLCDEIIGIHSSRPCTPNSALNDFAVSPCLVTSACPDAPVLADANQKSPVSII